MRIAILAASVLLLAACGPVDIDASKGSCAGGRARPIAPSLVIAALKTQGFHASSSTTSDLCGAFDPSVRGAEVAAYEVSTAQEHGQPWVSCILRRGPLWGHELRKDLDAAPDSPIFSGRKAEVSFENVECSIYPSDDDRADAEIRRFSAAIDAIARAVR
jgi:hypothetical protein